MKDSAFTKWAKTQGYTLDQIDMFLNNIVPSGNSPILSSNTGSSHNKSSNYQTSSPNPSPVGTPAPTSTSLQSKPSYLSKPTSDLTVGEANDILTKSGTLGNYVDGTPDEYKPYIEAASQKYGVPTKLLSGLIKQESGFNPQAQSPVGAIGIAQFMPDTAKSMGIDPTDPQQAIMGAGQYLSNSYKKYNDWGKSLASYNAGEGAVDQYGGVPPYPETQSYVANIMNMAGM